MAIKSFRDSRTERIFHGTPVRSPHRDLQVRARQKLKMLDAATRVEDLRVPPGNRLERLSGHRSGQWSIRVNQQWRLCFRWTDGNCEDAEFCDYH